MLIVLIRSDASAYGSVDSLLPRIAVGMQPNYFGPSGR